MSSATSTAFGADIASSDRAAPILDTTQLLAIDLACSCFWQIRAVFDDPWIFVGKQLRLYVVLQLSRKRVVREVTVSQDHECFCCHASIRKLHSENRALPNSGMFGEAKLDLERVNPLTTHLDEIVHATNELKKPVDILDKPVPGPNPTTVAHGLLGFVRAIPVARRVGVAANPHYPLFSSRHRLAFRRSQPDLISRHALSGSTDLL